jgi:hypothetical protein
VIEDLENLLPQQNQLHLISEDIKNAAQAVQAAQAKLSAAQEKSRESTALLDDKRNELERARKCRSVLDEIEEIKESNRALNREINELEGDLSTFGPSSSVPQVQGAIDQATHKLRQLQKAINTLQSEKAERMHELNSLEREFNRAQGKLADKERELKEKANLEARRDELKKEAEEHGQKHHEASEALENAQAPLKKWRRERDEALSEKDRMEKELGRKVDSYKQTYQMLRDLDRSVEDLLGSRIEEKLAQCKEEVASLEAEQQKIKDQLIASRQGATAIEARLSEARATERNISDNIRHRELGRQIAELDNQIASNNVEEAFRSRQHFQKEYEASRIRESELSGEAADSDADARVTRRLQGCAGAVQGQVDPAQTRRQGEQRS